MFFDSLDSIERSHLLPCPSHLIVFWFFFFFFGGGGGGGGLGFWVRVWVGRSTHFIPLWFPYKYTIQTSPPPPQKKSLFDLFGPL